MCSLGLRMLGLGAGDEASEESAHRFGAVPAHHVRRNLIADQIGEDGRVTAASTDAGRDCLPDLLLYGRAVEKGDML